MDKIDKALLVLYNTDITVHGNLINEGEIIYMCVNSYLTILGNTLSEEDVNQNSLIKIYPNPFLYYFFIESYDVKNINIFSLPGKLIATIKINFNNQKIILNQIEKGFYIIEIELNDGKKITKKIIKK